MDDSKCSDFKLEINRIDFSNNTLLASEAVSVGAGVSVGAVLINSSVSDGCAVVVAAAEGLAVVPAVALALDLYLIAICRN